MTITHLSSKGQVIIPKPIRTNHHWEAGQTLEVLDLEDGVLLRPKSPFPTTTIDNVAGCLAYTGTPKSLDDMESAIQKGVKDRFNDLG